MRKMEILFAPDWRSGVSYQTLLAEALERQGACVRFLGGYKRALPLARSLRREQFDILHLHWPEAYYPRKGDGLDWFRTMRFPYDLARATRNRVLVTTAHNFHIHNRDHELLVQRNVRSASRRSRIIFAHSERAKQRLVREFKLEPEAVRVLPHGDLSSTVAPLIERAQARAELKIGSDKLALTFGTVEPYKGLEEVITWWRAAAPPAKLAIVGRPVSQDYANQITRCIGNSHGIVSHLGWVADAELRLWLSAADAIVFNYREIFTSGAASLARSLGIPLIMPSRLDTVELGEPTPYVRRFKSFTEDFRAELNAALCLEPDFAGAAGWRQSCDWDRVAVITMDGYRVALGDRKCAA